MSLYDQRKSIETELVEKALTDEAFRQALLADPKAALEKEWGVTLPEGLNIKVHQEKRNELHVVLPNAAAASDELGSAELSSTSDSSWSSWGHFTLCVLECTQCGNNDTSCQPGPTGE
ncbi:MAG: hypothetical protein Tsb002_19360 [Wenzhouxiangellaceae bacterium]